LYFKYLVSGGLIVIISVITAIYSLLVGIEVVLGVSLATLVLGIVVLTTGLTYGEPLVELFKTFSRDLSRLVSKVLEDSGLLSSSKFRVCLNDLKLVISAKPVNCLSTSLGFGLVDDVPYLAMPLDVVKDFEVVGNDLRDYLREVLIGRFKVCRDVNVLVDDGNYLVELRSVGDDVMWLVKSPINYVRFLVLGLSAKFLSSDLELVNEDLIGSNYLIRFKVVT